MDPFLHRSIILSDATPKLGRTEHITQRPLTPHDDLSQHVRHLTIANFKGDFEVFNAVALEKIIGHVRHLQSFSWNTCELVPEAVISKLEASWPDTRLCVTTLVGREQFSTS